MPDIKADEIISPDSLVSAPTTIWASDRPPNVMAMARPTRTIISGDSGSAFALPRIPSVPNNRAIRSSLFLVFIDLSVRCQFRQILQQAADDLFNHTDQPLTSLLFHIGGQGADRGNVRFVILRNER